jgi:hypothetical protein
MNIYRFGLLQPAPRDEAQHRSNDALLGANTLGIEVTVPALAARCGLGNIDPQHSAGGDGRAAIEACLDHAPLPPEGAWLVTVRPDLDALGGAALLELRGHGHTPDAALRKRVALVARHDRFAFGPWAGPRPLPRAVPAFLESEAGGPAIAPLAALAGDRLVPAAERVDRIAQWLRDSAIPETHRRAAIVRAESLCQAVVSGSAQFETAANGRIAMATGATEGLLDLGYCLAPVVVAFNPAFRFQGGAPHAKFTIAQYREGYADLVGIAADLTALEPGWGGGRTIIGSPQGQASLLTADTVVAVVARRLMEAAHGKN